MEYTLPQLFKTLLDQGASDLHISAGSPPRLRIDGQIVPLNLPPLTPNESAELCYSVLAESQKKDFEREREIDLSFSVRNLARFRANIYYESSAVAGAFRVIPFKVFTLQELGVPRVLENLCSLKRGLVLVTGPTGSGKSTTLAAMINHINETRYDHIVTIEDPIEFVHNHKNSIVNQREIGGDTNSFARAMKSVLRQDPDVIMVGELRDLETISSALTLAETGHLVFGTLHTNTAVSSINRMVDAFPPHQQSQIRTQLSMTLESVISQTLLPTPQGGRVLAMEIMLATQAIRALVNEGKIHQIYSSIQSGQADSGMQTMNQALFSLFNRRLITKDVAISNSPNPDEFMDAISNRSSSTNSNAKKPRR
ncbi:type IV pilus twitching motility protein PilT [Pseudobacteriovorax antillogorgiicola]|uniref:Twitching motility protein PilT n=1 Tax=Pseudobacteriovorax antillogorgiicola TaxID=1513793 RepID=A0A1Y6B398_9BACT|nr:type IV pilus twitching motility protein PilT [Pseudobacteriovorax antillogorgiicola]TCS59340.1 twitching motility protein PilT [Pseudobacteriovorax antillogorgiicola]SME89176.1 twitching motility protein PilT [Pseudobacteriovorax antillogorgiicola]